MNEQTVYLVKFDLGYYAKKQPNYEWSYTADPYLAASYQNERKAKERGEWGIGLTSIMGEPIPNSYTIEKYIVKTVLEPVA